MATPKPAPKSAASPKRTLLIVLGFLAVVVGVVIVLRPFGKSTNLRNSPREFPCAERRQEVVDSLTEIVLTQRQGASPTTASVLAELCQKVGPERMACPTCSEALLVNPAFLDAITRPSADDPVLVYCPGTHADAGFTSKTGFATHVSGSRSTGEAPPWLDRALRCGK
ncbi:MAG: hypothetical protein JNM80_01345 [Phycisphaerae bacterium]|nr:hypothetical protein [Phycisphaerae bacterium]